MKSLMATVMVVAALLAAPFAVQNAHAQLELTIGGGLNNPAGEYGDQAKLGYSLITGLGLRVLPALVLGIEASFYGNGADEDFLAAQGPGLEMSSGIQQYTGMAKLMVPVGRHNLYGKGVLGSYRGTAKVSSSQGEISVENTDAGYGLGAGFIVAGEKSSSFFFDIMYHSIDFDGADERTTFVSYNIGAVVSFQIMQ